MKAAIMGANGYAGMVLTRLLLQHPEIDEVIAASRSLAGTAMLDYDPGMPAKAVHERCGSTGESYIAPDAIAEYSPDVVFSALPHLASADRCAVFAGTIPVIDLSADFRLRSEERFQHAYGQGRPQPALQAQAVYGLPEWYRQEIATAAIIASPGCFPTAILLPIIPLLRSGLVHGLINANALTGITGAGKKPNARMLFGERSENCEPYLAGSTHRHWSEIQQEIEAFYVAPAGARGETGPAGDTAPASKTAGNTASLPDLLFTPHLIPAKQGMLATITLELASSSGAAALPNEQELYELLQQAYADSPLVDILPPGQLPATRHVRGTGRAIIGLQSEGNRLLLFSAIDNLYKGAASQALQAMNIRFGFAEELGIPVQGEL